MDRQKQQSCDSHAEAGREGRRMRKTFADRGLRREMRSPRREIAATACGGTARRNSRAVREETGGRFGGGPNPKWPVSRVFRQIAGCCSQGLPWHGLRVPGSSARWSGFRTRLRSKGCRSGFQAHIHQARSPSAVRHTPILRACGRYSRMW